MKIIPLEITPDNCDDEEEGFISGHINCPFCANTWVTTDEESADLVSAADCDCPHLRFVLVQDGGDIEFYNGFTSAALQQFVETEVRKTNPNLDGERWDEYLGWHQFNLGFWETHNSSDLTHICHHTQEGMACGPVSHTVLFGVSLAPI